MTDDKAEDARLQDLWQRRDVLNEREWEELYQQVQSILCHHAFAEYRGLAQSPQECIADFFVLKVYAPAQRAVVNTPIHAGALRCYFRRFLIDLHRAGNKERKLISIDDEESTAQPIADLSHQHFLETAADTTEFEEPLIRERYQDAAREFLESQELWVRWYLRYCHCATGCGEKPVPLDHFKHLPSYYYKAQTLGIVKPANSDYRRTLLGRWLRSLDLNWAAEDDRDRIAIAFKTLCEQTLLWVREALPFQAEVRKTPPEEHDRKE